MEKPHQSVDLRKIVSVAVAALVVLGLLAFVLTSWRIRDRGTPVVPGTPLPAPEGMFLHWLAGPSQGEAVLDDGVFVPGKELVLHEDFQGEAPRSFHVEEVYDSVFDWVLAKRGTSRTVTSLAVVVSGGAVARAGQKWQLPVPSDAVRGQSTFRFRDNLGRVSPTISSSRIGKVLWKVSGGAKADPARRGAFAIQGEAALEGEVRFAVDPRIRVVVMVPWGKGEADLSAYLTAYLGADATRGELRPYLSSEPPVGWQFESSTKVLTGDVGKPVSFKLRVRASGAGVTLVALKAVDVEHPDNFAVSELLVLEDPSAASGPGGAAVPSPSRSPDTAPPAGTPSFPVPESSPSQGPDRIVATFAPRLAQTPFLTGIGPDRLARGTSAQLVAYGKGFSDGGAASFSGTGIKIKSALLKSSSELLLDVTVDDGAPTGSRTLTYTDSGGKATCDKCFTVTPLPTVTSVTPEIVFADVSPRSQKVWSSTGHVSRRASQSTWESPSSSMP